MVNYTVFVILLVFVVNAKKDKTDHKPDFLEDVNKAAKKQYEAITKNKDLTINEQEKKLKDWATENKVLDKFNAFEKNKTAKEDEIRKNITSFIEKVQKTKKLIDAVLTDKSLTKKQQKDKVDEIEKKNPVEAKILSNIEKEVKKSSKKGKSGKGDDQQNKKGKNDEKNSSEDDEEIETE